jgi:hypothetical protein
VRSPLPTRTSNLVARSAVPLLLVLACARPARALEIAAETPHERGGYVWVDIRLGDLFAPRVESSLARGMPATLSLHAERWRRRTGWFDRLESSFDTELRLRYYVVVAATLKPLSVEDAAEVEDWLSGQVEQKRDEPFGIIAGLPRSLFDAVRNFAGFGDEHARSVTDDFALRDLFPAP